MWLYVSMKDAMFGKSASVQVAPVVMNNSPAWVHNQRDMTINAFHNINADGKWTRFLSNKERNT